MATRNRKSVLVILLNLIHLFVWYKLRLSKEKKESYVKECSTSCPYPSFRPSCYPFGLR